MPPSWWLLATLGVPWLVAMSAQSLILPSHHLLFSVCLLTRALVTGFQGHLGNPGCSPLKLLNLIILAKSQLPNKAIFTASENKMEMYFFEGTTIQPTVEVKELQPHSQKQHSHLRQFRALNTLFEGRS